MALSFDKTVLSTAFSTVFQNSIEVSGCHTLTGLCKHKLPLHYFMRIKNDMELKIISKKKIAPGEARTHGLQIMRLTRCLLRYGGNCNRVQTIIDKWQQPVRVLYAKLFFVPTGGLEPPIFGLGDRRLIH